ncbi:MAG: hypothetical protein CSA74_03530 [Rhodobacterales bacterium]|nr:MAG: hypothetical protein CSA74_03530 [Rhodobacterales bacterium]
MADPILIVEGLTLRAADKLVLKDASFSLPPIGITALMGPVGTGKSTLLKWLCGKADPEIYKAECARADYFRAPVSRQNRPSLYGQNQAHTLEQLMMMISLQLADNPPLMCVDEATAETTEADAARIMERLSILAQSRAILMITHNQEQARLYSDYVMLLAGGRVAEFSPTAQFFEDPQTDAGRQFVGSGWVTTAGVDTPNHHLSNDLRTLPFEMAVSPVGAQGRLQAVVDGRVYLLTGSGDLETLAGDVADLASRNIGCVIAPAQADMAEVEIFAQNGMVTVLPGNDGSESSLSDDMARCKAVNDWLDGDRPVVFYSLGQEPETIRALALQLIYLGMPADKVALLAAELRGVEALDMLEEQELWDFELARDLESDGVSASSDESEGQAILWVYPDEFAPLMAVAQ